MQPSRARLAPASAKKAREFWAGRAASSSPSRRIRARHLQLRQHHRRRNRGLRRSVLKQQPHILAKENQAVTARRHKVDAELAEAAVRIFAVNDRLNQILIMNLDLSVWKAQPPGKVRTIAAIFAHMHNVRTKWVRLTAPHLGVPTQLNRARCTPSEARKALAKSADHVRRDACRSTWR